MLKLSGPRWIDVYDVADVFDLPAPMVGRLRTGGRVAVRTVSRARVYRYRLGDVEALADAPRLGRRRRTWTAESRPGRCGVAVTALLRSG